MLPISEACERNKSPILEVLRTVFASASRVLEIGSGTGQHAVHFAAHLPHVAWQPTERLGCLDDLAERIRMEGPANLAPPMVLDANQEVWPVAAADAVFTANTLHIMSWPAVENLVRGVARTLPLAGVFCVYGPFKYQGKFTSPSNASFDRMLRERDPASGLRELSELKVLASGYSLRLDSDLDLPAFNRCLVFFKEPA